MEIVPNYSFLVKKLVFFQKLVAEDCDWGEKNIISKTFLI